MTARLLAIFVMALLLAGCDRFRGAETRINAARPPASPVLEAWQKLSKDVAEERGALKAIEQRWNARLKVRALTCGRGYIPRFMDSTDDIRRNLADAGCFVDFDKGLHTWVGLQRVQRLLGQGPVRPVPAQVPAVVTYREPLGQLIPARAAPVAVLRVPSGAFAIIDLTNGKTVLADKAAPHNSYVSSISPNGRLFAQTVGEKSVIRATEDGTLLAEIANARIVAWMDGNAVLLGSGHSGGVRVLDLATAEETEVAGAERVSSPMVAPVPGVPNRFVVMDWSRALLLELAEVSGRYEAQVLAENKLESGGFSIGTGGASPDGKIWLDGAQTLRELSLVDLEVRELSLRPAQTQSALPTPNPDEFLVTVTMPTGDGITSSFDHYIYSRSAGTLAKARLAWKPGQVFIWIDAYKRLAFTDERSIRLVGPIDREAAEPVATVVARFADEINQRKLAAAARAASAAELGLGLDPRLLAAVGPERAAAIAAALQERAGATRAAAPRKEPPPLLDLLRDAQVEGVGVYQAKGPPVRDKQYPIEIRVRRTLRPVALVLSSYEPVRWMITLEPGASLAAVLLSSHSTSAVYGQGTARVHQIGRHHAYERGSAGFASLQNAVVDFTGKPIGAFQGRYEGTTFSVGGS